MSSNQPRGNETCTSSSPLGDSGVRPPGTVLKIDEVNTRKHTAVAENFEVHDNTLLLCSAAWLKGFVYGCCTAVLLYGRHGAPM